MRRCGRIVARVLLVLSATLPVTALADAQSHAAAAERLLQMIGIDSGVGPMATRMRDSTLAQLAAMEVPPGSEEAARPYLDQIGAVIEEVLAWEKLRGDFVDAYVATFTEAELKELSEFFQSPTGSKYLRNVTALNQLAAEIIRENAMAAAPRIREITESLRAAMPPDLRP
ncbi:MAG TPA: DUF2059 domain-containing protein [Pseudomonadales bacterium]|nr:DUF2059 domain-containing protein [Pseudomonadales bacterium]